VSKMQRTMTGHASRESQASPVTGFRLFGQQRIFSFDAIIGEHKRQQALTIGRDAGCDICLSDPAVSALHATIALDPFVRDPLAPVFLLRDCGSKNGIDVSAWGIRGPFVHVREVPLALGLHVRIGPCVLVAVDRDGACPIVASSEADLVAQAHALYGSEQEAARFIGIPVQRVRKLLARIAKGAAKS
jgi:hypothetical protein